ncbi:MAG: hypothetical protein IK149_00285 [Oscillospiraceae bacterium]|nr:hypothetical protein [Oscillospiraceae bacterium]
MKKIEEFLPHLSICLLLCLAVFTVLDGYNPFKQWLTSTTSKVFIAICVVVGIATAILLIARQRRRKRRPRQEPLPPTDQNQ